MRLILSTDVRNDRAAVIKNRLDAGGVAGRLELRTAAHLLLATCALSYPCATVSAGVLTFEAIADDLATDNDGTIDYGDFLDSNGTIIMHCGAGLAASDEVIKLPSLSVVAGGKVIVLSAAFIESNE